MKKISSAHQKEKVKVTIRLRPYLEQELPSDQDEEDIVSQDRQLLSISNEKTINVKKNNAYKSYTFDKVLSEETTQSELYDLCSISDYVDHVVEGYNATIFAYGQTGSGKTYTMEGYKYRVNETQNNSLVYSEVTPVPITNTNGENNGIIPRCVEELFSKINNKKLKKYRVYCSYLQIYQEKIYDLLNPLHSRKDFLQNKNSQMPEGLKIHFNVQNDRFVVDNLYRFECLNQKDLMGYFHYGLKNKVMSSHALNDASSRSHCILTITVESIEIDNPDNIVVSNLQLVDLAGSERSSQTTNNDSNDEKDKQLKKEAIDINKSLFTLRQVVSMLNKQDLSKGQYIPYRESKLTSLLRHSLGGNSYCLMIACISPSSLFYNENVSTLNYASKASCISNKPIKNHDPKNIVIQDLK